MLDGGGGDTNARLIITSGDATFSADGRKISGKGVIRADLSGMMIQILKESLYQELLLMV